MVCTDGAILDPDSFLLSGKTAKGVVFHVDRSGFHGLIVALIEVSRNFSGIAFDTLYSQIQSTLANAILDMEGHINSKRLVSIAESYNMHHFNTKIPAIIYCHYYDHLTRSMDVVPHGWYLPSLGEMNLLISQCLEVNTTLRKLRAIDSSTSPISYSRYWTSSTQTENSAWSIDQNFRIYSQSSNNTLVIRPVSSF